MLLHDKADVLLNRDRLNNGGKLLWSFTHCLSNFHYFYPFFRRNVRGFTSDSICLFFVVQTSSSKKDSARVKFWPSTSLQFFFRMTGKVKRHEKRLEIFMSSYIYPLKRAKFPEGINNVWKGGAFQIIPAFYYGSFCRSIPWLISRTNKPSPGYENYTYLFLVHRFTLYSVPFCQKFTTTEQRPNGKGWIDVQASPFRPFGLSNLVERKRQARYGGSNERNTACIIIREDSSPDV